MKKELTTLLPSLRRFAWSLTGSADDADDLVQATLERVLGKGVPEGTDLTRWSFTVCRNLWVDEYRAAKVRRHATLDPALKARQTVDGERHMHASMYLHQVQDAMQALPEEQRLVLVMVAFQGLSYKAVAEAMAVPQGTVMSRLARARARLVELLETGLPGQGSEERPRHGSERGKKPTEESQP